MMAEIFFLILAGGVIWFVVNIEEDMKNWKDHDDNFPGGAA